MLLKTDVVTGQNLLAALEQTEAELLRNPHRRRIRLIVIDSMANIFRCLQVQLMCKWRRLLLATSTKISA